MCVCACACICVSVCIRVCLSVNIMYAHAYASLSISYMHTYMFICSFNIFANCIIAWRFLNNANRKNMSLKTHQFPASDSVSIFASSWFLKFQLYDIPGTGVATILEENWITFSPMVVLGISWEISRIPIAPDCCHCGEIWAQLSEVDWRIMR